jgi:putative ABC transport system permease protein
MRSLLTVLGVAVGIGAVVCVVAIGEAGSSQIQQHLLNLGDNLVWIEAGGRNVGGVRSGMQGTRTLVVSDMEAIRKEISLVKECSAQVNSRVQLIYGNQNWSTVYRGVSAEYFDIKRWRIETGALFDREAVERGAAVAVLGLSVKQILFGNEDSVGKTMRINNVPFTVIGVLHPKGATPHGQDQDDTLFIPYTVAQRKIAGYHWLNDILCSAISPDAVKLAGSQAAELLRERHRIRAGQDDDFNIRNPEDMIQAQLEASRTFALFLVTVGSVSLLVGGIGIMNVMLVSVTERTHEIGVRMAVGATEAQVQTQFLGESVLLCLAGGVAGVIFGVGGTAALGGMLGWPVSVSPSALLIAAAFSVAIGLFFGYYPARKAAGLDPIEALRFE